MQFRKLVQSGSSGHRLSMNIVLCLGSSIQSVEKVTAPADLKVWAFSPPGGLISRSLIGFTEQWCTSVAVGKDVVPRMTVNNLNRLMDEMVTSLARCRYVDHPIGFPPNCRLSMHCTDSGLSLRKQLHSSSDEYLSAHCRSAVTRLSAGKMSALTFAHHLPTPKMEDPARL